MRRLPLGLRCALSLALSLPLSCSRGSTTPPDSGGPPPTTTPSDADSTGDGDTGESEDGQCRDWSDLDLSTLPPLPQTPHTEAFEAVWKTVLLKHYDPTVACLDWPAIRLEYGNQLPDKDTGAAYELMAQMLKRLGQSHLAIMPPHTEAAGEPRAAVRTGDARAPLRVRVLGTEAIVVDAALDGHKSGIPSGAAVHSIDGQALAPLIESMSEAHPREVEMTFAVRRVVDSWLSCPKGATKSIEYQALGAKKPKTRKVKCHPVDAELLSIGHLKNVPGVVHHRMIPKTKVGYLHFNIWMIPLVTRIDAAMAELRKKGMTSLIIDLRGNPGGVGAMVLPVGRQLLSEATSLGVMRMRESVQTFNVTAGEDPFTGPLVLLIDEGTASTSEIFGQALQDLGRAKVYGSVPSQGAALPSVIETLPGGGIFQFVVADYKSPKGIAVEGKGVIPDVVVPESREDYAKGRDPVLEAALADLGKT